MQLSPDFTAHIYKNAERTEVKKNPDKHLVWGKGAFKSGQILYMYLDHLVRDFPE